jgi:Tn3 transposase DDE domain
MRRASCLVLMLAAISDWQILDIGGVLRHWEPTADGIDPALLTHLSPIGWDNVVLYGEYHLDRSLVHHPRAGDGGRPPGGDPRSRTPAVRRGRRTPRRLLRSRRRPDA